MSFDQLAQALTERRQASLYRQRAILNTPQQPEVMVDGRQYLAFCSNDYLGLANHPEVIQAFQHAANDFGVGGGASHLVNGHSYHHHALEEELAEFTGRDRVLLFSNGYMANIGTITALLGRTDYLLQDRLNHASLLDAGQLCQASSKRYRHNDMAALQQRLIQVSHRHPAARTLVVTDGVFSMDGDIAALADMAQLSAAHRAWLMVDDAHGFGVLGQHGGGVAEQFGLDQQQLPVLVGTLGKAFGCYGAFVAGSDTLIETLIQQARPYIYTTSLPPAVAAASRASLRLIRQQHERRAHLTDLIAQLRRGCQQLGIPLLASATPIQPIVVGDSATALSLSQQLRSRGIWVTAIRPPTVPQGSARLRITLSAAHSAAQVDQLLQALAVVFHGNQ